jgi:hypothetical protein
MLKILRKDVLYFTISQDDQGIGHEVLKGIPFSFSVAILNFNAQLFMFECI